MDWLFGWFYDLIYILQKSICSVIDFIVNIFFKLSGLETVTINGKETDLLSHFALSSGVKTAFLGVMLIGIILLCIFVIIAILRSEYADERQKKTKGQILVKAGQSFALFLIIHIAGGIGRLATLPVGVLKDLVQGGAITAGKNIWPRMRNVATGRGVFNRADVIRKHAEKSAEKVTETNTEQTETKTESGTNGNTGGT